MDKKKTKIVKGKKFLITGGTGSFGQFIVNELLKYDPAEVRVFSRDEDKQYAMQHDFKTSKNLRFIIGDVRDIDSVHKAVRGVDIVLHAAALKQIPSSEYNIIQAVKTNILGAQNMVDACLQANVDKVLAISTDKAVEPINVMGMTKALQERIFILGNKHIEKNNTKYSLVRYGNVVASRGSVIPLFLKQIKQNKPVTLTTPLMTRFILTLQAATALVFNALEAMEGGEIFVPNIKALKIMDLAHVLVEELKPNNKEIIEIGIRPGEKIHETLISLTESQRTIKKQKYFIILPGIELNKIGYTHKEKLTKVSKLFVYSSDRGPFLTKNEIREMLAQEGII